MLPLSNFNHDDLIGTQSYW